VIVIVAVAVLYFVVVDAKRNGAAVTIITVKAAICIIGKTSNLILLFIFGAIN
jgi:hypothetical protein